VIRDRRDVNACDLARCTYLGDFVILGVHPGEHEEHCPSWLGGIGLGRDEREDLRHCARGAPTHLRGA
jgi:hypothetical protein